jgi:hypothetical protein
MESANYSREEEERLARALRAGEPAACPRCGETLARSEVPPRAGLPYVRDRVWLACAPCHRSLVLDRRRVEGADRSEG